MEQTMNRTRVVGVAAVLLAAGSLIAVSVLSGPPSGANAAPPTKTATSAPSIRLLGVLRDFRASNVSGGHPDFEMTLANGRAVYAGIAADELSVQGRPVFASTGAKVTAQAEDSGGKPIVGDKPYLTAEAGDKPATVTQASGAVTSEASFSTWFSDSLSTNESTIFPLVLSPSGGRWSFDGDLRTQSASFKPGGNNKVYSYTFAVETRFTHLAAANYTITAGADDAMWVYIDGKLVIDLGGAHDFAEQTIDLSRLNLTDGSEYSLHIFYAERDKRGSRFKIDTNIPLTAIDPPAVSSLAD